MKRGCLRLKDMAELEALKNRAGAAYPPFPPANKFRNVICEADKIKFRSKKERARYLELKALQSAGECWFLRQVPFYLPGNVKYVLDFLVFWTNEIGLIHRITFEDTKGKRTPMYIMKKKQVESLYPIKITEN